MRGGRGSEVDFLVVGIKVDTEGNSFGSRAFSFHLFGLSHWLGRFCESL